jgi:hypothetical protein
MTAFCHNHSVTMYSRSSELSTKVRERIVGFTYRDNYSVLILLIGLTKNIIPYTAVLEPRGLAVFCSSGAKRNISYNGIRTLTFVNSNPYLIVVRRK